MLGVRWTSDAPLFGGEHKPLSGTSKPGAVRLAMKQLSPPRLTCIGSQTGLRPSPTGPSFYRRESLAGRPPVPIYRVSKRKRQSGRVFIRGRDGSTSRRWDTWIREQNAPVSISKRAKDWLPRSGISSTSKRRKAIQRMRPSAFCGACSSTSIECGRIARFHLSDASS